jgi:hypothetical protein
MSACISCRNAKPLSKCGTVIIIGTITQLSTDVAIYVQELSTGRLTRYEATSDGAGVVACDFTNVKFNENSGYEIWLTLDTLYSSLEDKIDFTITGETDAVQCVYVEFMRVNGTITSQRIKAL